MGNGAKMSLKILFITQDDPFYVKILFNEFFLTYKHLDKVLGMVINQPLGKRSLPALMRQMWQFYGPWDFMRMGVRYSAVKAMGALRDPWSRDGRSPVVQLCRGYGIPVWYEHEVNGSVFLNKLHEMKPDLIVSVAASVIFKNELLALPRLGCVNIHSGMLPRYRGMMPVFWQMYHDEAKVGVTVHEMTPELDDGRILLQREVDLEQGETLDSVIRRTKQLGAHMIVEVVDRIEQGNVDYRANPGNESSYFTFPSKTDVKEFKRQGKRIL
jgi:methionyl-tRNA formyltransferase